MALPGGKSSVLPQRYKRAYNQRKFREHGDYAGNRQYYVINCVETDIGGIYASFYVYDFFNGNSIKSACVDVTNGTSYFVPDDSIFYNFANYYRFVKSRLRISVSDDPKALYPFQQGFISLTDGSFYTSGGCVISKETAANADIKIGDTVHLNTVARRGVAYTYFDAFDTTVALTVTGIFDGDIKYADCIFVAEDAGIKTETLSFTIGQLRFENGRGEEYLENLSLPENIKITLFDQGYGKAISVLNNMEMLAASVCWICLVAGVAFLVLTACLTVSNQKKTSSVMARLGVAKPEIFLYHTVCTAIIAFPAAVAGAVCAQALCSGAAGIMASNVFVGENALDYFIRDTYEAKISLAAMFAPPKAVYVVLISAGTLLCLIGLTALFFALSVKKKRVHTAKLPQKRKSNSLKGGACKYAWLSMSRGGGHTTASATVIFACLLLFVIMSASLTGYRQGFARLQKESTVSAHFTDIYGQNASGLVLEKRTADILKGIDGITSVTAGNSMMYKFSSVKKRAGNETYISSFRSDSRLVFTDNLLASPEFLTAKNVNVYYLDGFDGSVFSEKENRGFCVIPKQMQEKYNIELGDTINLTVVVAMGIGLYDEITEMPFKVVGAFAADNGDGNIYLPACAIVRDDNRAIGELYQYRGAIIQRSTVTENGEQREVCTVVCMNIDTPYSFISFAVDDCSKLENVKKALYDEGFSEVRHVRGIRSYIVFDDADYLNAFRATRQRLWYMEHLFPVIYALALILAAAVPFLTVSMQKKEMVIMRRLGQKKSSVFAAMFFEQLAVCIACLVLFMPAALAVSRDGAYLISAFILLWIAGTAAGNICALKGKVRV